MTDPPAGPRMLARRYRVDGLLGRGGMSEVFYGYDERLDRRVAIKMLRSPLPGTIPAAPDSPEAAEILDDLDRNRKRFLREIRTAAQLEHPGIPSVYDTGVEEGPAGETQLWLVMQLLRGSTLESVLDHADYTGKAPSVAWAAAIATQIAAVLADVHRVDIVHRDIKPANVMLVDGGLVKVLDFGIAILHGAGALPRLTQVDRTVGTPAYMSPEQNLGKAVTSASDIYSLGCLLCELLTGDASFHGSKDMPLRAHHLQSRPPSVHDRRSDVPMTVDALVSAMLAKDAQDRPTAESVYATLLPLAKATPDGAPGYESRDPTQPFRLPLLAPPKRSEQSADGPPLTESDAGRIRASVQILLDQDRPTEAISLLEDGIERAGHDPALRLRLRHQLGATLFYVGEFTRAASVLGAVQGEYRKYLPVTLPEVLDCSYYEGQAYAQIGNPARALPHLRYFTQNADPSASQDEANKILESRFVIAQMLAESGESDEAIIELEAIRPLLVANFGADSTQMRNLDKQIGRLGLSPT